MKKKPSVALVILNWNGRQLLERFLPSVVKSVYENLEIVVIDNGSTDDSVALIQKEFPTIKIIANTTNKGFAAGYNDGLKQLQHDYFILLNTDVEVPEHWIDPVIDLMETDPMIAAAQPKIKWQLEKDKFEYAGAAGGFIDQFAYPFCRGRVFDNVEIDRGQYNEQMDIFWASGAAFFVRRNQFNEIGGFDGDLFAHMEEIDVCWRLKNLGYRIVCCPDAEVFHVGGGTLNANNPFKTYLNFRNNLIIMQKNLPKEEAFRKLVCRFWLDFIAWIQFLVKGQPQFTMAISKAHFHFFKQFRKTADKRQARQISMADMKGIYPGSIVWQYFIKKKKKFSELHW